MSLSKEMLRFLNALLSVCPDEAVIEIRIMGALRQKKAIVSGYYDRQHLEKAATDCQRYAGKWKACYVTLNEVDPALLSRYANRLEEFADTTTADDGIVRRRWLFVDIDPVRPSGVSSSNVEHGAALTSAKEIDQTLRSRGWSAPILGDSGNGAHLLYPIDLPNDEPTVQLIKAVLESLAHRFDTDAVKVDTTTFNAARISKMYGTMTRKGDNMDDRPHRMAKLLHRPEDIVPVSLDLLQSIADELPPSPQPPTRTARNAPGHVDSGPFDMVGFIARHGLAADGPIPYQGGQKYQIDCPFNPVHEKPDAILWVTSAGAAAFKCSHNSCAGKDWHALRDLLEPLREQKQYMRNSPRRSTPVAGETSDTTPGEPNKEPAGPSVANQLVQFARKNCELWRSIEGVMYATVQVGEHSETYPVESTGFRRYLAGVYFDATEKAAGPSAIQSAVQTIDAIAARGAINPVYLRKADCGDIIYIDLCNDKWQAVKITPNGWEIVNNPPVRFLRKKGMLPLPTPESGGDVRELREFVNAPIEGDSDDTFILMLSWMLGVLGPHQPYPILNLSGEQGSAKTSSARILRALTDPAEPSLRREPKEDRDLAIAATNAFVVGFDNLSGLPGWLSDTLCCLATGGGFGTRKLHSDDDEMLFSFKSPVLLTGIGEASSRGDFMERSILLTLPTIPEENRKTERAVKVGFDAALPRLFGALLSIVAVGLKNLPGTELDSYPRMADFARWVSACEAACPWEIGAFLEAYRDNQAAGAKATLESDQVAGLLIKLIDGQQYTPGQWQGTAEQLRQALVNLCEDREKARLPKNARAISVAVKRISPALRKEGVHVDKLPKDKNGSPIIKIIRSEQSTEQKAEQKTEQNSDDGFTPFDSSLKIGATEQKEQKYPSFSSPDFLRKEEEKGAVVAAPSRNDGGNENTPEFTPFAPVLRSLAASDQEEPFPDPFGEDAEEEETDDIPDLEVF